MSPRSTSGKMWVSLMLITALAALTLIFSTTIFGSTQTDQPNIVIIISDDQNVDSIPVMRKLMDYPEDSWVKFNNAFDSNPICCPARATILTGQFSFHNGVISNSTGDQLDDTNTLAVWFDQAGYRTGLIGKYLNGYPWDKGDDYIPPGWDFFQTNGLGGTADGFTNAAVNFINDSSEPFLLFLAYRDPHAPAIPLPRYEDEDVYIPPDPPNFNEEDVSDKPEWIRDLSPLSQPTIDALRQERVASQRALLGVDDGIESILSALEAKGILENTMIIYLTDNGFSWGSHRWNKKACVYEECIRIPLFIRYPGLVGNREEERMVSIVDLAPTIADYAGVTPGLPQDGHSFLSLIDDTPATSTPTPTTPAPDTPAPGTLTPTTHPSSTPAPTSTPPNFTIGWKIFVPMINNTNAQSADMVVKNDLITTLTDDWVEEVFLEIHSWTARMTLDGIRVPGWTYAEYANGDKELYNLTIDPYQLDNKAGNPDYQEIQNELAQRLQEIKGNPPGTH